MSHQLTTRQRSPGLSRRLVFGVILGILLIVALFRLALPVVTGQRSGSAEQAFAPPAAATAAPSITSDLTAASRPGQVPSSDVAESSSGQAEIAPAVELQPTMTARATVAASTSTATATPTALPTATATETPLPTASHRPRPRRPPPRRRPSHHRRRLPRQRIHPRRHLPGLPSGPPRPGSHHSRPDRRRRR